MLVGKFNEAQIALIRLPKVLELVPFSKSHWWALVKEGKAPKPVKYGSITMWRMSDIYDFIDAISKGEEYPYK